METSQRSETFAVIFVRKPKIAVFGQINLFCFQLWLRCPKFGPGLCHMHEPGAAGCSCCCPG